MVKLTHFDINQFTPFSVGFDRVFDRLVDYEQPTKLVDSHHTISERQMTLNILLKLFLAGFSKAEIEVVLTDGVLEIKSKDDYHNR